MAAFKRLHFLFEPGKEPAASFAQSLVDVLGQAPIDEADVIISVGGDGLLLQALRTSNGKPVYGITPPTSNSQGFWTEHGVNNAQELVARLNGAKQIPLAPIEAKIRFTNGNSIVRKAFNSASIERASGQAVLMNVKVELSDETIGPLRIMGDGFVFSTAFGSTGLNRSSGGPAVDIYNNVILMVGNRIYEPRGIAPIVAKGDDTKISIDFGSVAHKRPIRFDYDGLSIEKDTDGSLIDNMTVRIAKESASSLLVTTDPARKAFSVLMPSGK